LRQPRQERTIENRVAIVTGASRGIGRAIAERIARDGRLVVGVARSADNLAETAAAIAAAGGRFEARGCDVGDSAALAAMVEDVAEKHGRLDILVNNAGITKDGLLMRMSDADFDDVIRVNLKSAFVACRAASRPMMKGRFGRIVNVGSVSGLMGNAGQANYAAAKAGLLGMTKSIARELGSKGITANVVAPGFIETDMTAVLPPQVKEAALPNIPLKRFGSPADIAAAIGWLTGEDGGYVTGQVIVVDGGMAM
jgi:3-oxoacyl-[acyl-carrier protein] reductase